MSQPVTQCRERVNLCVRSLFGESEFGTSTENLTSKKCRRKRPSHRRSLRLALGIDEWLAHHRLDEWLEEYLLDEFGISVVEDLEDLFKDEALLEECKAGMSTFDRVAFEKAIEVHTAVDGKGKADLHGMDEQLEGMNLAGTSTRKKKQDRKSRKITAVEEKLAKSGSMDVLIMLDCTTSMQPFIDAAKNRIRFVVQAIRETYPGIPLRIGFLGYRGIRSGADAQVLLPFQKDIAAFEVLLGRTRTMAGDIPLTDLTRALQAASNLDWSSAIRVLFHIGDYPCHGVTFHDDLKDDYPGGDPRGLRPGTFVQALADKKVKYCFGRLTHYTDKMIAVFNKHMGYEYIKSAPMTSITVMDVISSSITSLLTSLLSSSSSTDSPDKLTLREHTLVAAAPVWLDVVAERALSYSRTEVMSVEQLCEEVETAQIVDDFPDATQVHMRCAEHPFGKGRSKLAYHAQGVATFPERVLKQSLYSSRTYTTKEKFEEYMAPQHAALYLADLYNTSRPVGSPLIEFVPTRLVQFLARPGKPYFIEEPFIPGQWERFNNNTGYCAPFPSEHGTDHRAVQAFSHWTHHVSGAQLMVVDCQGCFDDAQNAFVLTDPAVHSTNLLAYGGTNMGKKGFERFFQTHRCNDTCRALGLPASTVETA